MTTATQIRTATHRLRHGEQYYDVEITKGKGEYRATWRCLACRAARDVIAPSRDAAEEQAFASVDAHQLFFHSHGPRAELHAERGEFNMAPDRAPMENSPPKYTTGQAM